MAEWYVVRSLDNSAEQFLHMFWEFHDFRIIKVNYEAEFDRVDVIFEYDDRELRLLLRFEGNVQMYVAPNDFEADWISGAAIFSKENQIRWMNCETDELEFVDGKYDITFFQADRILWSIIDKKYNHLPIPDDFLHQKWSVLNYKTMKYEDEFHDFTVVPF